MDIFLLMFLGTPLPVWLLSFMLGSFIACALWKTWAAPPPVTDASADGGSR